MSQQSSTACVNAPSRKIFAPMFRARWQSMQNIITDSNFYDLIPAGYKTYYITFIKQWLEWSSGFVPRLHRQDFFSTGMGYTVCDVITKECMSGGFRIHSEDEATKMFMEDWCPDDLNNVFNKMFFFANAGGNSILVLTPVDGELYPTAYPIDRAVFQIGRTGKITNIMLLNRFIGGEKTYVAKEFRTMKGGKAFYKVELMDGTLVTSPTWGGTRVKEIPATILPQWEACYGDIEPNKWYEMPERMRGIGCYNVRNKSVAVAIADLPGYSDSTLHTALDILYSLDYNYTQAQVDQYMGKSRTLVPKQMSGIKLVNQPGTLADGLSFREATEVQQQPLEDTFYTQVSDGSLDGKSIAPTFIQPDLRGEIHKFIRDADLELLASKVGLSASTLSTHLSTGGGAKTDDEITSESSATEKTVGNKRALANTAINAMLSDVAYFYGFDQEVDIQWGRAAANSARENQELMADYQAGTLPLRDYLRRRWSDLSEEDVEKMAEECEKKEKESRSMEFNERDYFGDDEPDVGLAEGGNRNSEGV